MSKVSDFIDPPIDKTRLLIEGVLETCTDEMIRLYILLIANASLDETFKVEEMRRNRRRIMVKFSKDFSFDECVARQKKLPDLCGLATVFRQVREPNTVRVSNLADSCTKEVLNLYFTNTKISNGGDIKSIRIFAYMNKALIELQDYRIIMNLLSQTHIVCEKQIKIEKYWGPIEDEHFLEEDERELQSNQAWVLDQNILLLNCFSIKKANFWKQNLKKFAQKFTHVKFLLRFLF